MARALARSVQVPGKHSDRNGDKRQRSKGDRTVRSTSLLGPALRPLRALSFALSERGAWSGRPRERPDELGAGAAAAADERGARLDQSGQETGERLGRQRVDRPPPP